MLNVVYRNCRKLELLVPIGNCLADNLQLIVPNLHRRYFGVTASARVLDQLADPGALMLFELRALV